jgi:hypothetical protein
MNCKNNQTFDENIVAIKRNDDNGSIGSLDNLFGYNATDVEHENEIEVVGSGNLGEVIEHLDECLEGGYVQSYCDSKVDHILTPKEINIFLSMIDTSNVPWYRLDTIGTFVSHLVRSSYNAGNSQFDFQINSTFGSFLSNINAKEDKPLRANIKGDIGSFCGYCSSNLVINLEGKCKDNFASNSNNLTAKIKGNCGQYFGSFTNNFTAEVNGNFLSDLGGFDKLGRFLIKYNGAIGNLFYFSQDLIGLIDDFDNKNFLPHNNIYVENENKVLTDKRYAKLLDEYNQKINR